MIGILIPLLLMSTPVQAFPSSGEMIQRIRDHESEQNRTPIEESINRSLTEYELDGSDDTTESEELLQLPSDEDKQGTGRRHDRCHHRSWIRFIQERTGKNCGCGHSREEDKGLGGESPWDRRYELDEGKTYRNDQG